MSAPIRTDSGRHAADSAHTARAEAEHTGQTTQARGLMRAKVQHTKMQRARLQHNQMLAAAFYRGKRFAEGHHKPPPSAQALLRQLGARPRPGASGKEKERGKEVPLHERPDLAHGPEHEHDRVHRDGHEQKRERHKEHEHEQGHEQQQRNGHGHGHGHDQGREGREGGQSQGNASQDGQPKRDGRDAKEERAAPRKFAVGKAGRAKAAARRQALVPAMQLLAKQKLGAPGLPHELATACTKEVLRLTSQLSLGPLLAVPLLLSMTSPMALRRNAARLQAHRSAALAQNAATPARASSVAALIGLSLDNTLARQSAGIAYSDDDQSIAMVKQRILDVLAARSITPGTPADGSTRTAAHASDTTREVRTAPVAPGPKT